MAYESGGFSFARGIALEFVIRKLLRRCPPPKRTITSAGIPLNIAAIMGRGYEQNGQFYFYSGKHYRREELPPCCSVPINTFSPVPRRTIFEPVLGVRNPSKRTYRMYVHS